VATAVHFISGVADPFGWAQRVVNRAHLQGLRLWVVGAAPTLRELGERLCADQPVTFLPLASVEANAAVRQRSPLQMHDDAATLPNPPPGTRLLNLSLQATERAAAFDEVLDCVSLDTDAVAAGRMRYRSYVRMGLDMRHTTSRSATP
jgi:DNA polymerase III subunit chi